MITYDKSVCEIAIIKHKISIMDFLSDNLGIPIDRDKLRSSYIYVIDQLYKDAHK